MATLGLHPARIACPVLAAIGVGGIRGCPRCVHAVATAVGFASAAEGQHWSGGMARPAQEALRERVGWFRARPPSSLRPGRGAACQRVGGWLRCAGIPASPPRPGAALCVACLGKLYEQRLRVWIGARTRGNRWLYGSHAIQGLLASKIRFWPVY